MNKQEATEQLNTLLQNNQSEFAKLKAVQPQLYDLMIKLLEATDKKYASGGLDLSNVGSASSQSAAPMQGGVGFASVGFPYDTLPMGEITLDNLVDTLMKWYGHWMQNAGLVGVSENDFKTLTDIYMQSSTKLS